MACATLTCGKSSVPSDSKSGCGPQRTRSGTALARTATPLMCVARSFAAPRARNCTRACTTAAAALIARIFSPLAGHRRRARLFAPVNRVSPRLSHAMHLLCLLCSSRTRNPILRQNTMSAARVCSSAPCLAAVRTHTASAKATACVRPARAAPCLAGSSLALHNRRLHTATSSMTRMSATPEVRLRYPSAICRPAHRTSSRLDGTCGTSLPLGASTSRRSSHGPRYTNLPTRSVPSFHHGRRARRRSVSFRGRRWLSGCRKSIHARSAATV